MIYRDRVKAYGRRASMGLFMPFVIIIALGVIFVMGYKLWNAFFGTHEVAKAAYMHMISGSAQMKTWGTENFFDISGDATIMQGDEIVTSADAKTIIEFIDGTIMRVGNSSDLSFEEVNMDSSEPSIQLLLVNGKVWVNKLYRNTGKTKISIKAADISVRSDTGNIFEIESGVDEVVRVFDGNDVHIDVLNEAKDKVVQTEELGVGQEIVFNAAVLDRYWKFQSPSVIAAISADFYLDPWSVWNKAEDKNPTLFELSSDGTQFTKVEPEVKEPAIDAGITLPAVPGEVKEGEATSTAVSALTAPILGSVTGATKNADGSYTTAAILATLKGTVAKDTAKVMVNDFVLQKFKAGDTNWTYYANAYYGYMKAGENIYNVYAIDADGKKSVPMVIKVTYNPPAKTGTVTPAASAAPETPAVAPVAE